MSPQGATDGKRGLRVALATTGEMVALVMRCGTPEESGDLAYQFAVVGVKAARLLGLYGEGE